MMAGYELVRSWAIIARAKYYVVALTFAIFLIAQHWLVFPYHDDWGLSVLDYVVEAEGFVAQEFEFHHVFQFLNGLYLKWTGRVVGFFVQIYLFKYGLEYVRLFQVMMVLIIIYFSLRMASIRTINHIFIILPISLYLALPMFSLTTGFYWFSAASVYVWGIPIMLAGVWQLTKVAKPSMLASVLLGISATFHEQMAIAVFVYYVMYVIVENMENLLSKKVLSYIAYSLPIVSGVLFNLLAPGNFARLRSPSSKYGDGGIFDIILTNANSLSDLLLAKPGKIYLAYLGLSFTILAVKYYICYGERIYKILHYYLILSIVLALCYFYAKPAFVVLFLLLYGLLLFLLRKGSAYGIGVLSLYSGCISMFLVLLFAPGVASRSLLTFYFIMFIPIVYSFSLIATKKMQNYLIVVSLILLPFSLGNSMKVYHGYYQNYEVNRINHSKLSAAKYDYEHGGSFSQPITLYKLPNPAFAETMPYDRPLIEKWIKKFYALPSEAQLKWN